MLCIKTDLEDKNWLVYIVEEFKRINRAEFDIQILDINHQTDCKNIIYYSKHFNGKNTIPNKSYILPDSEVIHIRPDLFILKDTDSSDRSFLCRYDLFWNAFVFLSRLEEYLCERKHSKIRSYSIRHPRKDKSTFYVPVVNVIFDELEHIINISFPHLGFSGKIKPVIELSHDIDYLESTIQQKIKYLTKKLSTKNGFFELLKNKDRALHFLYSKATYRFFEKWEAIEKKNNKISVFYCYAQRKEKKSLGAWLIDPSYDIKIDKVLQNTLKHLMQEGFEVGLHGSYESAVNERALKKEKEILAHCLDSKIIKIRQHWLRYEENSTPYGHEKLFQYDSTLGWNDIFGFRSGCVSRYRPYDHKNKRAFNFFETPMIMMDANVLEHTCKERGLLFQKAKEMILGLEAYKNSHVSICWHQRVLHPDYGWGEPYQQLVSLI